MSYEQAGRMPVIKNIVEKEIVTDVLIGVCKWCWQTKPINNDSLCEGCAEWSAIQVSGR